MIGLLSGLEALRTLRTKCKLKRRSYRLRIVEPSGNSTPAYHARCAQAITVAPHCHAASRRDRPQKTVGHRRARNQVNALSVSQMIRSTAPASAVQAGGALLCPPGRLHTPQIRTQLDSTVLGPLDTEKSQSSKCASQKSLVRFKGQHSAVVTKGSRF